MKSIIFYVLLLPFFIGIENSIEVQYLEANSGDPTSFTFSENELVVQTDSILHYGYQYTSYYALENVNDSIFKLTFKRQYAQDNTDPENSPRRKKIKNGRSFWFDIDKYDYWTFTKLSDEKYTLSGYALEEKQFRKKLKIQLASANP